MQLTDTDRADIKDLVCDILELDPEEVTETSHFVDDHGADSLLAIEILSSLEKKYRVKIDQAKLARMGTMAGIFEVLDESDRVGAA
ncbi:acyl carrier protein [Nocardia terpenica]|uniref:Polyketide-8 synthase acyl carrier protein n=1 Tax=Nocardia terpenica TaxID=455432 RepID=A0A164LIE9_9NOCA|nr:acyl carrier protein [Nocardia terpenica]ATL68443.1 polyketide-8 synthase acyl carrier protein [Nocardia terpenica]KZM72446.1 polyketide-8 synthase acyl carrier protein [Nocardia terpenica]MBF6059565.1 acyl carrier protein [Nocardia terpenica]MBF6102896.1 acyl carrier protein [Nocardia terpenica]MBF6110915.1 acyl carrier protein [Nocardia terpenica]